MNDIVDCGALEVLEATLRSRTLIQREPDLIVQNRNLQSKREYGTSTVTGRRTKQTKGGFAALQPYRSLAARVHKFPEANLEPRIIRLLTTFIDLNCKVFKMKFNIEYDPS